MNVTDAAEMLGVTAAYVKMLCKRGTIKSTKVEYPCNGTGFVYEIEKAEVLKFMRRPKMKAGRRPSKGR